MNSEMMVQAMRALGDPTRYKIVQLLSSCPCGEGSVQDSGAIEGPTAGEICCRITGAEKITSTVSHHLHELEAAGVIEMEKRGKRTICRLKALTILQMAEHLSELAKTSVAACR